MPNNHKLRAYMERLEHLDDEKVAIGKDISELLKEAKGEGYVPAILKKLLKIKKVGSVAYDEEVAMIEAYRAECGLFENTPMGAYVKEQDKGKAPS
jgi:uncharacterized protein (UPF0335 family)